MHTAIMIRFAALFVALLSGVQGHRFAQVELSKENAHRGDDVTVTCEVVNPDGEKVTIVWLRKVGEQVFEIGSNVYINAAFKQSGRMSASYSLPNGKKNFTKIIFKLDIEDVQPSESGELGCRIEEYSVEVFKNFTVLMPIRAIKLTSQNLDGSHAISFVNDQKATFNEDERRRMFCYVNGSYPLPNVNMTLGDQDVTGMFEKSVRLIREGPVEDVAALSYEVTLSNPSFEMSYDYLYKRLQCAAHVPDTDFPSENIGVTIKLSGYKPKFKCENVMYAFEHKPNVNISCRVMASPVLEKFSVFWDKHLEGNRTMVPGESDGHYTAGIINGSTPEENTLILRLDRVFPQHFRQYTFLASNSLGTTTYNVTLKEKDISEDPDMQGAATLESAATALSMTSSLLMLLLVWLL